MVLRFADTWLLLVSGGGPTAGEPVVVFGPQADVGRASHAMTLRVADCRAACGALRSRGAAFFTAPHDWGTGIRCFLRDRVLLYCPVRAVRRTPVHAPGGDRFFTELRGCTAELVRIIDGYLERPVPACPGWTFRQLATHLGRGHRWAATPIPLREVAGGKLPQDPAQHALWLNASAGRVIDGVTAAGSDLVWTLAGIGPASFWARRRAREAAVHLADAQLAAGRDVDLAPEAAADGVDEWLARIAAGPAGPAGPARAQAQDLRGDGQSLHFHATDPGLSGTGEWLVTRAPSGVTVAHGHGKADVAVRGPAASLLPPPILVSKFSASRHCSSTGSSTRRSDRSQIHANRAFTAAEAGIRAKRCAA